MLPYCEKFSVADLDSPITEEVFGTSVFKKEKENTQELTQRKLAMLFFGGCAQAVVSLPLLQSASIRAAVLHH